MTLIGNKISTIYSNKKKISAGGGPTPTPEDFYFITEWTFGTGIPGFVFPAGNLGVYDAEIDFGDGSGWLSVTAYNDANLTHDFSVGTYNVRIRGTFPYFDCAGSVAYSPYLTDVVQWGDVGCQSLAGAFQNMANVVSLPDDPQNAFALVTDYTSAFRDMTSLTSVGQLDVSNGTTFFLTFDGDTGLTGAFPQLIWGSPTNLSYCWRGCTNLTSITGVGDIDITALTTAAFMLDNVTLDTSNYSSLLIGWEAQTEPSTITLDGGDSKYTAGAAATARAALVSNGWIITDGGLV